MDAQIDTLERYIEKVLKLSFVMTRQPDCINVMQTPSTQRIVSKVSHPAPYLPTLALPPILVTANLDEVRQAGCKVTLTTAERTGVCEGELPRVFTQSPAPVDRYHLDLPDVSRRTQRVQVSSGNMFSRKILHYFSSF